MKPILLSIQFLSWCSNCHLPKWMCELSHRESKIPCVQLLTRLAFLSYFQDIKNEGGSSTPSSLCIAYVPNQPLTNHTVHTQPHNTSCTIIERNPHCNKSKFFPFVSLLINLVITTLITTRHLKHANQTFV